jgi:hypothetical protein
LTSLTTEYTSFWQDPSFIEMAARIEAEGSKRFFSFPEQTESWSQGMYFDYPPRLLALDDCRIPQAVSIDATVVESQVRNKNSIARRRLHHRYQASSLPSLRWKDLRDAALAI